MSHPTDASRAPSIAASSPRALRSNKELVTAWTLLLLRDIDVAYGYTLHRELLARDIDLQRGRVYRWLIQAERDRLVASRWSRASSGPQRHIYELTAAGRLALRALSASIAAMRTSYDSFLDTHAHGLAQRAGDAGGDDVAAMHEIAAAALDAPPGPPHTACTPRPPPLTNDLLAGWLLLQLDCRATYGYGLRRELDAQHLSCDSGGMYRMLRRLEADDRIRSRWMTSASGPRRRFYCLTSSGRSDLDEFARLFATIREAHDSYLRAYEPADATRRHAGRPHQIIAL